MTIREKTTQVARQNDRSPGIVHRWHVELVVSVGSEYARPLLVVMLEVLINLECSVSYHQARLNVPNANDPVC